MLVWERLRCCHGPACGACLLQTPGTRQQSNRFRPRFMRVRLLLQAHVCYRSEARTRIASMRMLQKQGNRGQVLLALWVSDCGRTKSHNRMVSKESGLLSRLQSNCVCVCVIAKKHRSLETLVVVLLAAFMRAPLHTHLHSRICGHASAFARMVHCSVSVRVCCGRNGTCDDSEPNPVSAQSVRAVVKHMTGDTEALAGTTTVVTRGLNLPSASNSRAIYKIVCSARCVGGSLSTKLRTRRRWACLQCL